MSVWFLFHHLYIYIYIYIYRWVLGKKKKEKKKLQIWFKKGKEPTNHMERNTEKEKLKWKTASTKQSVKKSKGQVHFVFQIPNRTESLHRTSRGWPRRKEGSLNNFTTMWSGAVQERTTRSLSLFLICCSAYLLSSS